MTPAEAREHLGALGLFLGGVCSRQWLGDHVCLAEQPSTPYGSPDELVDRGVAAAAEASGRWARIIVEALAGATTEGGIRSTLARIGDRLRPEDFAGAVHDETLRGALLGSADSQWERVHGIDVAPARFDDRDPGDGISGGPHAAAIRLWNERKVLTPDAFHALDAGMRRRAFTVAGMAKAELLDATHAELGRLLAAGATHVTEGPNFRDFSKFVDKRLVSAGWTPANPSHVETIFRTNVMSAYSAGRHAEMTQPHVLQAMPYWQIRTVKDSRQRKTHRAADGVILRADDHWWQHAYPPFGYNCRCRVCSRSQAWVTATNAKIGPAPRDLPDPGFTSGTRTLVQVPRSLAQVPTATPLAPVSASQEPMVARSGELAAAMDRGDGSKVRGIVRDQVSALMGGAASRDPGKPGGHQLMANSMPATIGARAFHEWTGEVVLDPRVKAQARGALTALAAGQYSVDGPRTAADIERIEQLDGLRTLVHEEVHGFSRVSPYSYGGIGRILEEVGTELTARHVVRTVVPVAELEPARARGGVSYALKVGGRERAVKFGSYPLEIEAVTAVLRLETGLSEEEAHALIRKAHAEQVCGRGWHFNSKAEHLDAFLRGLDQSAETTQAIRQRLLRLDEADGDIGIPSR